jgi:hypothetical protein
MSNEGEINCDFLYFSYTVFYFSEFPNLQLGVDLLHDPSGLRVSDNFQHEDGKVAVNNVAPTHKVRERKKK